MESTFARTGVSSVLPLLTISKALNHHPHALRRLTSLSPICCSSSLISLKVAVFPVTRRRLQCLSSSLPTFRSISNGGSDGFSGYNGGGEVSDRGDSKSKLSAGTSDSVSVPSSDIIVLNVGGMTCGGCSASVKKILESQPQVASASVNLTTETAIVWPVLEAKTVPDWQKSLGETLANHLTNCGFQSTPQDD